MKLGVNLGYWGAGNDAENLEMAREADRLGYSVVWAAEAYGSDALTPLAWYGSQTTRIKLGTGVASLVESFGDARGGHRHDARSRHEAAASDRPTRPFPRRFPRTPR